MKCTETKLTDDYVETKKVRNGLLHIFENYCVLEVDEGIIVDFENSEDILFHMYKHYGYSKPFGFIANRINSYSINLADAFKFNKTQVRPVAHALVSYEDNASKFIEVENKFCSTERQNFSDLNTAEQWVLTRVNAQIKANRSA